MSLSIWQIQIQWKLTHGMCSYETANNLGPALSKGIFFCRNCPTLQDQSEATCTTALRPCFSLHSSHTCVKLFRARYASLSKVDCLCSKPMRNIDPADEGIMLWEVSPPSTPPLYFFPSTSILYRVSLCRSCTLKPPGPIWIPHCCNCCVW